ncbi:MAG: hypothetical protein ACFFAN_18505 [Promethearchaeota archaeon]
MKEPNQIKKINQLSESEKIEIESALKQRIMNLNLKKMKKKNDKSVDPLKFIGFIDTDGPTDSLEEHDLI